MPETRKPEKVESRFEWKLSIHRPWWDVVLPGLSPILKLFEHSRECCLWVLGPPVPHFWEDRSGETRYLGGEREEPRHMGRESWGASFYPWCRRSGNPTGLGGRFWSLRQQDRPEYLWERRRDLTFWTRGQLENGELGLPRSLGMCVLCYYNRVTL